MADKVLSISKVVDLGTLTSKLKVRDVNVTGCSLNAGITLTVYGGKGLLDADILADIDASPSLPPLITLLKTKIDTALEDALNSSTMKLVLTEWKKHL